MTDTDPADYPDRQTRELLNSLGDGVTLADARGRIVFSNRAADRILGVGATDAPAEAWADHYGIFLPEDRETPFPEDQYPLVRAIEGESTRGVGMWIRNPSVPDGVLVSVTGRPVKDDGGEIVGATVVFRDITELRRTRRDLEQTVEELARTQRQKDELSAFVVHDLKGPITAILLSAQLLLQNPDFDEKDREMLDDINGSAEELHRMVLDLLDIQLAEDGRLDPNLAPVPLGDLLHDVGKGYRAQAMTSETDLRVVDPSGDLTAMADADLLHRIVSNLIANSFKYAKGGTVRLSAASLDDPPRCRITIEDDGPSVPRELREEIFRMWNQLERDERGRHRDSRGIGLHFARRATEAQGGRIGVDDSDLGGARFWIEMPRG